MAPIWFLMGPTAAGKTDIAVALAEIFPFEIVSVDASMVYRGMDIGTAKPGSEVLARVPHHLIDIRQPEDTYSAADFCADADGLIQDIHSRGKYPLLVGGTMFYFRALELGLPDSPTAQPELRQALEQRGRDEGWGGLYQELCRLDPNRAAQIKPTDKQRIQRALEIVMVTGRSSTEGRRNAWYHAADSHYTVCKLALAPSDRLWLHRRIAQRFTAMLEAGFVDEVRQLLATRGLPPELPALRMVGYRQVVQFLSEELGYNEMVRRGIAGTRQLAKRQLTWLRNQPGVTWIDCKQQNLLNNTAAYVKSKLADLGLSLEKERPNNSV